jgi:hypothetical protein
VQSAHAAHAACRAPRQALLPAAAADTAPPPAAAVHPALDAAHRSAGRWERRHRLPAPPPARCAPPGPTRGHTRSRSRWSSTARTVAGPAADRGLWCAKQQGGAGGGGVDGQRDISHAGQAGAAAPGVRWPVVLRMSRCLCMQAGCAGGRGASAAVLCEWGEGWVQLVVQRRSRCQAAQLCQRCREGSPATWVLAWCSSGDAQVALQPRQANPSPRGSRGWLFACDGGSSGTDSAGSTDPLHCIIVTFCHMYESESGLMERAEARPTFRRCQVCSRLLWRSTNWSGSIFLCPHPALCLKPCPMGLL